jgi:hypothetical protein
MGIHKVFLNKPKLDRHMVTHGGEAEAVAKDANACDHRDGNGMNLDSSHYSGNSTNLEKGSYGKMHTKYVLFHKVIACISESITK